MNSSVKFFVPSVSAGLPLPGCEDEDDVDELPLLELELELLDPQATSASDRPIASNPIVSARSRCFTGGEVLPFLLAAICCSLSCVWLWTMETAGLPRLL